MATKEITKEMSQKEALYIKKVNKRKLSGSLEFTTARLGWQVTLALGLFFLFQAVRKGGVWFAVAGVYLAGFALDYIATQRIIKEVTGDAGAVSDATRQLGWLMLPFVFVGDFFMFIAGAMLIR